ncbi:helix-turn-helix transcriptional regulator [Kribbella sancticallisti]|uniref:helix-turn-helix transcriptional regulator n=1 Tax=Kribbella sancticallisti TaxID=460087 RepID=UPI0031CE82D9
MNAESGTRSATSLRRERRQWSADLRAFGSTWVEIADVFADRYGLNPRVAFRLAHGWSQREAAEHWNRLWPADLKTFKNFSYWEQWPATTGYAPSLDVLARLAELYQCSVSDLVTDLADFRGADSAQAVGGNLAGLWLSRYSYYSSGRDEELHGEHTVRLRQAGGRIFGNNDASERESRLTLDLSLSAAIATGTWTERTSPAGYYRGAVYHGTIQLVVSPQGRSMAGRWLGFNKEFEVNTGEWRLEWLDD